MPQAALIARIAEYGDCDAIATIYNQGIDDRIATFETRHRTGEEIEQWLDGHYPVVVVTLDDEVIAFASTAVYRPRECYDGVADFSVYVRRDVRGTGAGKIAMSNLIAAAEEAGFWKLVSRVFPENKASLGLLASMGFREVGIYRRHARLEGKWQDVVIVEKLIGPACED
jgi:phosphinothricin acetyltransferase